MKYTSQSTISGNWAKNSDIKTGTRAKIISETKPQPSNFQDKNGNPKTQDVAKVKFEGSRETVNVSLNRATIGGLIHAFGDDSVGWIDKILTAETEKMRVGGRAVVALYLLPEGYKKIDDENGFATVVQDNLTSDGTKVPDFTEVDEVDSDDVPF